VTDTPPEREEEGGWAKLRRRKVVQWSLAYAAGAWLLLQVLAYVSGSLIGRGKYSRSRCCCS